MRLRVAALLAAASLVPTPAPALQPIIVTADARGLHPGELVVLTVESEAPLAAVRARAFGRVLHPWAAAADGTRWRVLAGIDLDTEPGTHVVTIEAVSASGTASATHPLVVTPKTFPTRRLTVDPAFVNPPAGQMARIAAEARALNQLWDAPVTTPAPTGLVFAPPVPHRANSAFGTRSVFNGEPRSAHGGADFLSPAGTPVQAPAHGTVVLARDLYYTGGTVVLDHGAGVFSVFAHLSEIAATVGDTVPPGTVVGLVGATGRVTGAHLHWTLRAGGTRVDPLAAVALLGPPDGTP